MADKVNVYQIVTDKIIGMIETNNTVPWKKPWNCPGNIPRNLVSRKNYRGINLWLLGCQGYADARWGTFKQITEAGGTVKKDEKSSVAVFYRILQKLEKRPEGNVLKNIPLLRYYRVFNVLQCEGLKLPEVPTFEHDSNIDLDSVGTQMEKPVIVRYDQTSAFYRPSTDTIHMPEQKYFENVEEFYICKFHEMSHATGHKDRLNRPTLTTASTFGSETYNKEELVAELSAAFIAATVGIDTSTIQNSASYLKGWLAALKEDAKMLVQASSQAQAAAEYILGTKAQVVETTNEDEGE